jgi:hypothetical protein
MTTGAGHAHKNKAELQQLLSQRGAAIARQSAELVARDLLIENSSYNSPICVANGLARSTKRWTRSLISLSWRLSRQKQRRNSIIASHHPLRRKPSSNQHASRCRIIYRVKKSCCRPVSRVSSAAGHYVISARMYSRRWSICMDGSKSSERYVTNCHAAAVRPFIRFQRHPCRSNGGGWDRA